MKISMDNTEKIGRSIYHICAFEKIIIKFRTGSIFELEQMESFSKIEEGVKLMGLRISFDIDYECLCSNSVQVCEMISTFKNYQKCNSVWLYPCDAIAKENK